MKALGLLILGLLSVLPARADEALLARLAEPNTHAIMRHALAPGSGEPEGFDISRCETQRNLDEQGRRQARRAGDMLRAAGVQIDHVWSSRWCRCMDTAREMDIGEIERQPFLRSFSGRRYEGPGRTRDLRAALSALPPGETAFLVTHNVNAEALTGVRPISGEIQVIHVAPSGEVTLLGRVEVPIH